MHTVYIWTHVCMYNIRHVNNRHTFRLIFPEYRLPVLGIPIIQMYIRYVAKRCLPYMSVLVQSVWAFLLHYRLHLGVYPDFIPSYTSCLREFPSREIFSYIGYRRKTYGVNSMWWLSPTQVAVHCASTAERPSGLLYTSILFVSWPLGYHFLNVILDTILDLVQISLPL